MKIIGMTLQKKFLKKKHLLKNLEEEFITPKVIHLAPQILLTKVLKY